MKRILLTAFIMVLSHHISVASPLYFAPTTLQQSSFYQQPRISIDTEQWLHPMISRYLDEPFTLTLQRQSEQHYQVWIDFKRQPITPDLRLKRVVFQFLMLQSADLAKAQGKSHVMISVDTPAIESALAANRFEQHNHLNLYLLDNATVPPLPHTTYWLGSIPTPVNELALMNDTETLVALLEETAYIPPRLPRYDEPTWNRLLQQNTVIMASTNWLNPDWQRAMASPITLTFRRLASDQYHMQLSKNTDNAIQDLNAVNLFTLAASASIAHTHGFRYFSDTRISDTEHTIRLLNKPAGSGTLSTSSSSQAFYDTHDILFLSDTPLLNNIPPFKPD